MPSDLQVLKARMRDYGLNPDAEHANKWWEVLIDILLSDDSGGGGCSSCSSGCSPGCQSSCAPGCTQGHQNG